MSHFWDAVSEISRLRLNYICRGTNSEYYVLPGSKLIQIIIHYQSKPISKELPAHLPAWVLPFERLRTHPLLLRQQPEGTDQPLLLGVGPRMPETCAKEKVFNEVYFLR